MTQFITLPPQPILDLTAGTVISPINISDFLDTDYISVALPAYPNTTIAAAQSYLDITSNPTGNCDVGPTDSIPFSASTIPLIDGDSELRVPLSLLVNIDRKAITGIRFRIQASTACTFRAMAIRCVSSTWEYAPIDMDTLYHRGKKPVAPNGSLSRPADFPTTTMAGQPTEFPILFRSDNPPGVADPRPIDAEASMAFNAGSLLAGSGEQNAAVSFNDSYIDIGNPASLRFTNSFALEAWIKPNRLVGTQAIVSKYLDLDSKRGYRMGITAGGEISVDISQDGTAVTNFTTTGAGFTTGLWQHVFMQYKVSSAGSAQLPLLLTPGGSTASVSVYKNGNLVGSTGGFPPKVFDPTFTNLVLNPSFTNDASNWICGQGGTGGSLVRSTANSFVGSSSGLLTKGTNFTYAQVAVIPVVSGQAQRWSVWVYPSATGSVNLVARPNLGTGFLIHGFGGVLANQWTRLSWTFTPDGGATSATFDVGWEAADATAGTTLYIDAALNAQTSLDLDYFDGGSAYSTWGGTPNASTSTFGVPFRIANWP